MEKNGQERKYMNDKNKVFFDSNILVYTIDSNFPDKQVVSSKIIKDSIKNNTGFISTQCLQEFYNVSTKKLNCSKEYAKTFVEGFSNSFEIQQINTQLILSAIDISIKYQFSFWDSLIISSAISCDCSILYSEDLSNGQVIEGIKIVNPFM